MDNISALANPNMLPTNDYKPFLVTWKNISNAGFKRGNSRYKQYEENTADLLAEFNKTHFGYGIDDIGRKTGSNPR